MNHRSKTKRIILISSSILAVLLLGTYTYAALQRGYWPFHPQVPTNQNTPSNNGTKTSDDPNTKDPTYGSTKNENSQTTTPDSSGNGVTKKQVGVGIASAGAFGNQAEVRAFVTEVIEGDGVCTATFTKNGVTVTGSSNAFIDASTSQCKPIDIDLGTFSERGTWNLVVSYSSPTSVGSSSPMEVSL